MFLDFSKILEKGVDRLNQRAAPELGKLFPPFVPFSRSKT